MAVNSEASTRCRMAASLKPLLLLVIVMLSINHVFSQRCTEINPDTTFTVRQARVDGRWVPPALKQSVIALINPGGPFRNSQVSAAQAIVSERSKVAEAYFPPQLAGAIVVSYTDASFCRVAGSPKTVDVVIHPYYLRIDFFHAGRNLLPIPRSPNLTFYQSVPKALLALSPAIGFAADERYGPSVSLQTETDFLHLSNPSSGAKGLKLNANFDGRKSFSQPFYTAGGGLQLLRPVWNSTSLGWSVGAAFLKKLQPLAQGRQEAEDFSFQTSLQRSPNSAVVKKWLLGGSYRLLQSKFDTVAGKAMQRSEQGYRLAGITDLLVKKNFGRIGLWFHQGFLQNSTASYRQLSGRAGYRISFLQKTNTHQSVDVDLLAGAGKLWGDAPAYSQFYAGNAGAGFLYQNADAQQMQDLPSGAVIRSIGEKGGALSAANESIRGGTAYWHFNLNFSLPVKRWSRPLIPDVLIDSARGVSLQKRLRSLAKGSAESGVAIDLIDNKHYPENSATDSAAAAIVAKEILPMISFVTDRANVVAFKPLLLFDVGGLQAKGLANQTYVAAGAGFQLTVVIAHLQAGYMRTLSPSTQKGGNFFLQLLFENFF